jgi:hypothetical protein
MTPLRRLIDSALRRIAAITLLASCLLIAGRAIAASDFSADFLNPPDTCRPGVYWYVMDGHLSREGITRDLESMKAAGIGNVLFLEVNVGVPRGKVDFLTEEWQDRFAFAVHECERLGMELTLGSGPGWAGSGGPWVTGAQSMQHLVASRLDVTGPGPVGKPLAVPPPHAPYFGPVPASKKAEWSSFYRDVCVLAVPTPAASPAISDIDEKALYVRAPYSSTPGVRTHFDSAAEYPADAPGSAIQPETIVDLTDRLKPDDTLDWRVPAGNWTILRFVSRNNGAITRPAPQPGIGFECDKWDTSAFDAHLNAYVGKLLAKVGPRKQGTGWTRLHIDSWEMGAQNWTPNFREEFKKRRGYDPQPFYPAYLGMLVGSREQTERFLWDLRQTGSELIVEHHADHLREFAHQHGFDLSIEPYDMHPGNDFDLGAAADLPMGEFWAVGFNTSFSCIEATSVGHVMGRSVIGGESFTSAPGENWRMYPGNMKDEGDWALATGINRFTIHTFAHKPDETRPGMQMGPYGVHWDRGQTFWPMVGAYHRYLSRCSCMLRQGRAVADVLYLTPEGAPNVFRAPASALDGSDRLPDRRGYNFDACSTTAFIKLADVRNGAVVFPGGASYRLVVLPRSATMTPALVRKLDDLIAGGATVVGDPPIKSPSLENYPACDAEVAKVAGSIWGDSKPEDLGTAIHHGKGQVFRTGALKEQSPIYSAHWIWYPQGSPAKAYPVGSIMLRRAIEIDGKERMTSAAIDITADNRFTLKVNGATIGTGDDFHRIERYDLAQSLKTGENQIEVQVDNTGDSPNPAGFIAAIEIHFAEGSSARILTDDQWTASKLEDKQTDPEPAMVLGDFGMSPWSLPAPAPEIYPDYQQTAGILAAMHVVPDFVSTGPVRYTHRTADDREIYFLANRSGDPVDAACTFRVTGRSPQAWDAVTGEIRDLPEFHADADTTSVPLHFEPYESRFIIFPAAAAPAVNARKVHRNVEQQKQIAQIEGPWQVAFDPSLGGPAKIAFDQLQDWTQRAEPGIKYYSGIATYRREFNLPGGVVPSDSRLYLDLGVVHAMARVRLNGHDCGVAWTAPWRADIASAAKEGRNELEIEVANLWPNRMIGDAISPKTAISQTTYHPWKSTDPLLASGLIGPVRILNVAE